MEQLTGSRAELAAIRAAYVESVECLRSPRAENDAARARLRTLAALPSTLINYDRRNAELERACAFSSIFSFILLTIL